jgi:hypothetical protein
MPDVKAIRPLPSCSGAAVTAWLVAALCLAGPAQAADGLKVEAVRSGTAVAVSARAGIHASHEVIWATLTDYEHLADFVPGIRRSHVIARRGPAAIVEQEGEAGLLFVKVPVHVIVESAEAPPLRISIRVLRGNLRQLVGRYELERGRGEDDYILRWQGIIEPDVPLPAFIAVPLMRASIEEQFAGMVREIERRQLARARRAN